MDYLDRAGELIKQGLTNIEELTEILVEEGFDINDKNKKKVKQDIRNQMKMLKLSKDHGQARTEKVKGKEELKPVVTDMGGYYQVTSGERSIEVTEEMLKKIKRLYCGESKLTINHICRTMNIPRRDFVLIKTAFGITHDDVPYTDKELRVKTTEELVIESLEGLKDAYFKKLEQDKIKEMERELAKYRKEDYKMDKIGQIINEGFKHKGMPVKEEIKHKSGLMLEIPIVDLHLGKLAWSPETGEKYNHKIARKRFMTVINDVLSRTDHLQFEKILFPIGNDFFNFDTLEGATTKGTRQDNDVRWQQLYNEGIDLLIGAVEILSQKSKVEVFLVPGNHDFTTSFYAIKTIEAFFRNNVNVIVNADPKTRKYIEFGKCLIGYTHMDKEGKRIFGNMQVEAAKSWGKTKYREWHGGHLHSEQVKEDFGVKVRNLTSVTSTDAWHKESGYVGAIATSQSFIWHKEKGLREILYSTVEK